MAAGSASGEHGGRRLAVNENDATSDAHLFTTARWRPHALAAARAPAGSRATWPSTVESGGSVVRTMYPRRKDAASGPACCPTDRPDTSRQPCCRTGCRSGVADTQRTPRLAARPQAARPASTIRTRKRARCEPGRNVMPTAKDRNHHARILNSRLCSLSSCRVTTISSALNTSSSGRTGRSESISVMMG